MKQTIWLMFLGIGLLCMIYAAPRVVLLEEAYLDT